MAAARSVHISKLRNGDQLRIALKAGHGINPDHQGIFQPPNKQRSARGYTRTTFYAYLQSNDPVAGKMVVTIQDMVTALGRSYTANIEYSSILILQQVVPYGRPVVETAPVSHPGAKALGTKMSQLFPQPYLIPVLFVGA
jgi:hypothetical protein